MTFTTRDLPNDFDFNVLHQAPAYIIDDDRICRCYVFGLRFVFVRFDRRPSSRSISFGRKACLTTGLENVRKSVSETANFDVRYSTSPLHCVSDLNAREIFRRIFDVLNKNAFVEELKTKSRHGRHKQHTWSENVKITGLIQNAVRGNISMEGIPIDRIFRAARSSTTKIAPYGLQ